MTRKRRGILLGRKRTIRHAKWRKLSDERTVQKLSRAVQGILTEERGEIGTPIARDPVRRNRLTAKRSARWPNARQSTP